MKNKLIVGLIVIIVGVLLVDVIVIIGKIYIFSNDSSTLFCK